MFSSWLVLQTLKNAARNGCSREMYLLLDYSIPPASASDRITFVVLSVHFLPQLHVRFARYGNGSESKMKRGRGHGASGDVIGARTHRVKNRTPAQESRAHCGTSKTQRRGRVARSFVCHRFFRVAPSSEHGTDCCSVKQRTKTTRNGRFFGMNRFQPKRRSEFQRI